MSIGGDSPLQGSGTSISSEPRFGLGDSFPNWVTWTDSNGGLLSCPLLVSQTHIFYLGT